MEKFDYDVALSFAGEDRAQVEPIANLLKSHGVNVFYDSFESGALWGKDLYQHLSSVYFKKSRFCIVFISGNYIKKSWTNHELKSAQARAFSENQEYLLPIRLDDSQVSGILPTVGYIKYSQHSPNQIVQLILEKLDQSGRSIAVSPAPEGAKAPFLIEIPMPKIRRSFTQREKDKFGQEAFEYTSRYFEEALRRLEVSQEGVETEFMVIHRHKFIAKIYVNGESAQQCKIWLGSWSNGDDSQLLYSAGRNVDPNNDSSLNEMITIEDDGHRIVLKLGAISSSHMRMQSGGEQDGTAAEAAEYLWRLFTHSLAH